MQEYDECNKFSLKAEPIAIVDMFCRFSRMQIALMLLGLGARDDK